MWRRHGRCRRCPAAPGSGRGRLSTRSAGCFCLANPVLSSIRAPDRAPAELMRTARVLPGNHLSPRSHTRIVMHRTAPRATPVSPGGHNRSRTSQVLLIGHCRRHPAVQARLRYRWSVSSIASISSPARSIARSPGSVFCNEGSNSRPMALIVRPSL